LLLVLVSAGAGSLVYWHWTEFLGPGDLRYYALVQFYPMISLPVITGLLQRKR
jgi:hypothetical protein